MSKICLCAALAAAVMTALGSMSMPAAAHHSFAMFDQTQRLTTTATVTRFDWLNPHSWLYVSTLDDDGNEVVWGLEAAGTLMMASDGWSHDSVRSGDQIEVDFHPLKDGTNGGQLLTVKLPDGTELCSGQGCREGG